jgi:hypothetical protein
LFRPEAGLPLNSVIHPMYLSIKKIILLENPNLSASITERVFGDDT